MCRFGSALTKVMYGDKAAELYRACHQLDRACADQSRLMDSDPPPRPVLSVEDFTVNLIDTIMAIIQAPTSVASGPDATGG